MRALTLTMLLAACSDPSVPPGATAADEALTVVSLCTHDDLRLFSGPTFQGTELCLRGSGYFNGLDFYLPGGTRSVLTGTGHVTFRAEGSPAVQTEDFDPCTSSRGTDSIVQNAFSVEVQPNLFKHLHCP